MYLARIKGYKQYLVTVITTELFKKKVTLNLKKTVFKTTLIFPQNKKWEISGGNLVIYKVARHHQGQYICQGSNIEGDVRHKTTVLVNGMNFYYLRCNIYLVKLNFKTL